MEVYLSYYDNNYQTIKTFFVNVPVLFVLLELAELHLQRGLKSHLLILLPLDLF